ncbi:MAG: putative transposase [Chitinophagaceae bacterium]
MATTRTEERMAAAMGLIPGAPTVFKAGNSIEHGAILLALPALESQGLLKALEVYDALPQGYYNLTHILLLLAYMSLLRIDNPEQLKTCNPGELGRIMGLDRVPEMRCLRQKIKLITEQHKAVALEKSLFAGWLNPDQNPCLFFYIDGHVKIYFGDKANLSKTYVSRQKLCLCGTTEYWVNDRQGSPYLSVIGELNEHLRLVIEEQLVPRLLEDTRDMVTPQQLDANPLLPRFILFFDREAYDTSFFVRLWKEHRIAIVTYRKNVKDKWSEQDFKSYDTQVINNKTTMLLCEKPVELGGHPFREVRKLSEGGHQTSIITTDQTLSLDQTAGSMFSRWSQENYFRYMIAEFNFDKMVQYGVETIDENTKVVNPTYNKLTQQIKKATEKHRRAESQLYELMEKLQQPLKGNEHVQLTEKQATVQQTSQTYATKIAELKAGRKEITRTIALKDMPEANRYNCLKKESKLFMNVIRMIAYRAETVLYNLIKPIFKTAEKEGRQIIQSILKSDADILPDYEAKTLTVKIHGQATPKVNELLKNLCDQMNETKTIYPQTDLTIIFKTG